MKKFVNLRHNIPDWNKILQQQQLQHHHLHHEQYVHPNNQVIAQNHQAATAAAAVVAASAVSNVQHNMAPPIQNYLYSWMTKPAATSKTSNFCK